MSRRSSSLLLAAAGILVGAGVWSGVAASAQQPPAAAANGAQIYKERCATCHDATEASATRAPSRDALRARTVPQIVASLDPGGSMATNATGMSAAEKQAVAAFLSATAAPTAAADPATGACPPSTTPLPDPATLPMWNGWGNDGANTRFQNAKAAGLTAADVPKLTLKWAFGYANSNSASGQPTVAAGRVFVGNTNGMVYGLDLRTGCTYWTFKADGGVRTAMSVARLQVGGAPRLQVMFGDVSANAYALDAQTGALLWKLKVDTHPVARITGAPSYANGRLFVPVSSIEEVPCGSSELPVLHLPRQRRRDRRRDRQAGLEDLHDSGRAENRRQELDRHADLEVRWRRDLDLADDRHARRTWSTSRPATPTPSRRRRRAMPSSPST